MPDTSVITKYRREILCKITSGNISSLAPITHIAFGSGGIDESGEPLVPSELQNALNNELARYPIDSVWYPENTTAQYTVTIPEDALAGSKISEAALVDSSGNLCAIRNFYVKQKDSGISFVFAFNDEF